MSILERVIEQLEKHRENIGERREAEKLPTQRTRGKLEQLLARVLSGVIYCVLTVAALFAGSWPTTIVVCAMAWLCCSEFYRMARLSGRLMNEILGLTMAVAFPLAARIQGPEFVLISVFVFLVLSGAWYVVTPRANISDVALTFFGPIYTALPFAAIVTIRGFETGLPGFLMALAIFGSVWANDTAAYFVGSRLGRHKLAPRISPNKSVEGFWGGMAAAVLVWLLAGFLHVGGMTVLQSLIIGPLVGVASVAGDLFESRIKRGVGVKDSGDIMPGHGGLLDRSDALLFGSSMAYLLLHLGGIL